MVYCGSAAGARRSLRAARERAMKIGYWILFGVEVAAAIVLLALAGRPWSWNGP